MKKVNFEKLQAGELVQVPRTQFAPQRYGWNGWLFSEAVVIRKARSKKNNKPMVVVEMRTPKSSNDYGTIEKAFYAEYVFQTNIYHGGGSRDNNGCRKERQGMRAVFKECEDEYIRGYADALEDMRRRQQARRQQERDGQARRWYFFKQKALGVIMLAFTVLAVRTLESDATIAIITVPLGLALIFSRQKLVVNDYYFETEERQAGNGTDIRAFRRHW